MIRKLTFLTFAALLWSLPAWAQYQNIPIATNTTVASTTGTDSINLSGGITKITLTTNESNQGCTAASTPTACCTGNQTGTCGLTINRGTLPITASSSLIWPMRLTICQDATGTRLLNILPGTNVTNICYNGGATCSSSPTQPGIGYTLTPSNGDVWTVEYNGTNVYLSQSRGLSNVPCP